MLVSRQAMKRKLFLSKYSMITFLGPAVITSILLLLSIPKMSILWFIRVLYYRIYRTGSFLYKIQDSVVGKRYLQIFITVHVLDDLPSSHVRGNFNFWKILASRKIKCLTFRTGLIIKSSFGSAYLKKI